jgi:hypothetical protein
MADHTVTLTEDEEIAYAAYVAFLQTASESTPIPFPPVTPVASVDELLASHLEAPKRSMLQWYLEQ